LYQKILFILYSKFSIFSIKMFIHSEKNDGVNSILIRFLDL
jgi:hypothetical protein